MITVEAAGAHTRLEDGGAHGRAHEGVSLGGAADMRALLLANRAVGNADDACALEATLSGPTLRFLEDTRFVWCGGDWPAALDGAPVPRLTRTVARAGSRLTLGTCRSGLRAVVACAGGFDAGAGTPIARGATLGLRSHPPTRAPTPGLATLLDDPALDDAARPWTVRVTDAPQTAWFSLDSLEALVRESFSVTPDVSRRGVHLRGPALLRTDTREPISEGIAPGSIQVTHAGDPIVLHVDQTTTGGYAKIACVARVDLWKIGQLRPGSRVRFTRVSLEAARDALHAWHARLDSLS